MPHKIYFDFGQDACWIKCKKYNHEENNLKILKEDFLGSPIGFFNEAKVIRIPLFRVLAEVEEK